MPRGDDEHETSGESTLDRTAILARRRRFIALALSGLANAGCTRAPPPEPCLSIAVPEDEGQTIEGGEAGAEAGASGEAGAEAGAEAGQPSADSNGPFVEDPGVPVQSSQPEGEGDEAEAGETEADEPETVPKPRPRPCLKKAAPTKTKPQVCLLMVDLD